MSFEWAATVELRPRWSSQTVYYNPENPADAVLEPGIQGSDLLVLLFALPIDIQTCALWGSALARLREKTRIRPAGGLRVHKKPGETRVALAETTAIGAGFYGMGAAAFLAAFPVVVASGFRPRPHMMTMTWAGVLATGVAVFIWRAIRNRSGIYDLRLDERDQTVTLPQSAGRPKPLTLARRKISGVSMQRRVSTGPSGTHFSYLPALNCNGSSEASQSIKLITLGWSEEKARAFSQWLSQELGVEFKGIEEEIPECAPVP
jgi:hypothetical protein